MPDCSGGSHYVKQTAGGGGDIKIIMARFGKRSTANLAQCHPLLQRVFNEVIKHYNHTILVGRRGEEAQNQAVADGKSKLTYPHSKHNPIPSKAVDAAPWFTIEPHIRWWDTKSFYHFGGFVLGVAAKMGVDIRWGGNWDMDDELHDQHFNDLVHFELKE